VVASNFISISSGSDLSAGNYYIDEMMNCESFHGEMRLALNDDVEQDTIFIEDEQETPIETDTGKTEENLVTVYPNPTQGQINIQINGLNTEEFVVLEPIDLFGKVIFKETGNTSNYTFDLSTYPKSLYLLKVKIGDELVVKKVMHQ